LRAERWKVRVWGGILTKGQYPTKHPCGITKNHMQNVSRTSLEETGASAREAVAMG
jgi:hypothetical protein